MLTLADVLEALTGTRIEAATLVINEAAIDSRQVIPGAMFVALPGERTDGHNFVGEAFKNGAGLALIEHDLPPELARQFPIFDVRSPRQHGNSGLAEITLPSNLINGKPLCLRVESTLEALQSIAGFYRRKQHLRVIGITGSVGKSTTKELVAQVLAQRYCTLKNAGNLNNEIGLPLTLLRLTPGHQRAVLEMGFYVPGEIALLCHLAQPSVGVLTNIGTVHAERAGSQEMIARGKAELVQALPPDGVAILNYDDPWVRPMAQQTHARILYYGMSPEADLWADQVESMGLEGIRFRMHFQNEVLHLRVPLIGQHSVHTALRAAAVGLVENLTWGEIIDGLRQAHAQLRLVAVRARSGALLLDDSYNASPESTLAALNLLNELEGRRVAVLGEMLELGPYERQGHEIVGARAAEVSHRLVVVGERARIIAEAALRAGLAQRAITWVSGVPEAIQLLNQELNEGDVVLIKGSHGLRMDRIVNALEEIA